MGFEARGRRWRQSDAAPRRRPRVARTAQRALLELILADQTADTAAWREVGEDVLRACLQQQRLLEACLTLARSQAGRCEAVELGSIVAEVVQSHDLRQVAAELTLGRARTVGDRALIERLVSNLVTNAVCRPVPAAEVTRLFEPFEQLPPRATGPPSAIGLGLAVVTAVADAHHAVITARARPYGGLRIDVAFPATSLAHAPAP